jgi:hypothetical protein
MTTKIVTEPGFYNGRFLKPGMSYAASEADAATSDVTPDDLTVMTKDQLLAEAERRGIDVDRSMTKAEIIAALTDAA